MMTLLATWTATKSEGIWNSRATRSRLKIGRSAEKSGMLEEDATKAPKPCEGSNETAITSDRERGRGERHLSTVPALRSVE